MALQSLTMLEGSRISFLSVYKLLLYSHKDDFTKRHDARYESNRIVWKYGSIPFDGTPFSIKILQELQCPYGLPRNYIKKEEVTIMFVGYTYQCLQDTLYFNHYRGRQKRITPILGITDYTSKKDERSVVVPQALLKNLLSEFGISYIPKSAATLLSQVSFSCCTT